MNTILEKGHSWLLYSSEYKNEQLCIILEELMRSTEVKGKLSGSPIEECYAKEVLLQSRRVCIRFSEIIAWQFVNESCDSGGNKIIYRSKGFLSEVTESPYYTHIKNCYGWYSSVAGEFRSFHLWSENEIIEVVSTTEPNVFVVD